MYLVSIICNKCNIYKLYKLQLCRLCYFDVLYKKPPWHIIGFILEDAILYIIIQHTAQHGNQTALMALCFLRHQSAVQSTSVTGNRMDRTMGRGVFCSKALFQIINIEKNAVWSLLVILLLIQAFANKTLVTLYRCPLVFKLNVH